MASSSDAYWSAKLGACSAVRAGYQMASAATQIATTMRESIMGSLQSSTAQLEELQRSTPRYELAKEVVGNVGAVMLTSECADLDAIITDWANRRTAGPNAWKAIQAKVLRNLQPTSVGLESMIRAMDGAAIDRDRPEHIRAFGAATQDLPGSLRPMLSAGVVSVEANAIFDLLESIFAGDEPQQPPSLDCGVAGFARIHANREQPPGAHEAAWVKAMHELGPNVSCPDVAAIKHCFRCRAMEALRIECPTLAWLKLVKVCTCLEVVRHVKAPPSGLPAAMLALAAAPVAPASDHGTPEQVVEVGHATRGPAGDVRTAPASQTGTLLTTPFLPADEKRSGPIGQARQHADSSSAQVAA